MFENTTQLWLNLREIPNLFVFKCVCHFLDLTVSYACKVLPPELLTLFDDIHRFLKCRLKRQDTLRRFQNLLDLPEHKILRFLKLQWLSLVAFVSHFIEQYDALFIFFQEAIIKDKEIAAEATRILWNAYISIYLNFAEFFTIIMFFFDLEVVPVMINHYTIIH